MSAGVAVLWGASIGFIIIGLVLRQWTRAYAPIRSIPRWLDVSTGLISLGFGAWCGSAVVLAWRVLA